jgi:hypothetical protein
MSINANFELTRVNSLQSLEKNREDGSSEKVECVKKRQFAAIEELSEQLVAEAVEKGLPRDYILPRAIAYYEKHGPFRPVDTSDITEVRSVEGFLKTLLSQYPGICLGEFHSRSYGLGFLVRHMKLFAELGVDRLGVEAKFTENEQKDLDYFERYGVLLPPLEQKIARGIAPALWKKVLNAARANGIRIIAIDTHRDGTRSQAYQYPGWEVPRLLKMNAVAREAYHLYKTKALPQSKFIFFTGVLHMDNHGDEVPGIGPLVQFPTLAILGEGHCTFPSIYIIPNYPIDYNSESNPDLQTYPKDSRDIAPPMTDLPPGTANFALL